jgi:hypothetical protein
MDCRGRSRDTFADHPSDFAGDPERLLNSAFDQAVFDGMTPRAARPVPGARARFPSLPLRAKHASA